MNYQEICSTPEGRLRLLTKIATDEDLSVRTLTGILPLLPTERTRKIAAKHLSDEVRHTGMITVRLLELGATHIRDPHNESKLDEHYEAMAPQTISDKYQAIQLLEELVESQYSEIADALRPHDNKSAELFDGMVKDETAHLQYCKAILDELGGPNRMARYRDIYFHPVEVYSRAIHFDEIQSWGEPIDPDAVGTGLVIPGRCCGFVGVIGGTKTCYFYGLRANPRLSRVTRGLAILRLSRAVLTQCRRAGFTRGVTETANPVVERFWTEKLGFKRSSGSPVLLEGMIR